MDKLTWPFFLFSFRLFVTILTASSGGSRISLRRGRQPSRGDGRQHTILPNFPENYIKRTWVPGGASLAPPLDPPLASVVINMDILFEFHSFACIQHILLQLFCLTDSCHTTVNHPVRSVIWFPKNARSTSFSVTSPVYVLSNKDFIRTCFSFCV